MRQKCFVKEEKDLFERRVLQVRLDSTASKHLAARYYLTVVGECLQQHRGLSSASHLRLERLLVYLAFGFVVTEPCLISDEVAAHPARLKELVAPASYSLELDSSSIAELLRAAERGCRLSTASPETSGMHSFMPAVPGND